ncbi:hypothetical protein CPB83DRAFT_848923 [Crepidotus variabilis]|uniref:Uncharacterized protein n=1 Tax=Crepidotus variabilis TaxID=179855 RepID=A0A9P6ELM1_9AGAR|nr:hypothetical protein CPB83DRAFT_848923 [Crepidotus variabilis]
MLYHLCSPLSVYVFIHPASSIFLRTSFLFTHHKFDFILPHTALPFHLQPLHTLYDLLTPTPPIDLVTFPLDFPMCHPLPSAHLELPTSHVFICWPTSRTTSPTSLIFIIRR